VLELELKLVEETVVLVIERFLEGPKEMVVLANQGEEMRKRFCPVMGYKPSIFQRSHDSIAPASELPGRPPGVGE